MRIMLRVFGLSVIFMFVCLLFMQMMSYNIRQEELTQTITTAMTGTQTVEQENIEDTMYGTDNARLEINDNTAYKNLFIKNFAKLVGGDEFTSAIGPTVEYRKYNDTVGTMPSLTRDGYTFVGWYDTPEGGNKIDVDTKVKGDIQYYAHWKTNTYTITYNLNGGTLSGDAPTSFTIETETISIPNPTKVGKNFLGWQVNGGNTHVKNYKIQKGTFENITLTAVWE